MSVQTQLRELYLIDQQVRGMRRRVDAAARRLDAQRSRLEQYERQAEEVAAEMKAARARAAQSETDAAGVEERINKIRQTMTSVRNNKEYSALLVEINTLKVKKGKIDDLTLEHMSRVEELESKSASVTARHDEQAKLVELAEKEIEEASAEISDQLSALERDRDAAAEPIDAAALGLYRKLLADFDGEALAEVEEQDRRRMKYTCGACFMSLPIQVVNAALTVSDRPIVCPNCDRILYVPDALKEALAPK